MKQCPLCHRTFSEELNYCLDDGTRLLAADDSEVTRVSQRPSPATPGPVQRQSNMALGAIVIIVVVGLLGVLMVAMVAIWLAEKPENNAAASNVNSSPTSYNWSENASPSPAETPHPVPSPSPSPTTAEPVEKALSTGTYQCEVTRALKSGEKEGTGTIKYQFTFNSDGTYLMQGYITVYGTTMNDQLGIEEKGTYSQSNTLLLLRDRLDREYDLETNSWKSWTVPSEGSESSEQIRNVTPTTFQLYDDDEKGWFTFAKL